ncbi:ethanolamine utilization protein EutP [Sporomusaceae bacterium BoRhaA]|nr:ethanolamine utilization protein EutP [Pelorhabdus rhamnosifermentans]
MEKVMFVGAVGAGKTSLIHVLQNDCQKVQKTQSIIFTDGAIDTPGEYAQIPRFYSALLITAVESSIVVIVQDATDLKTTLPPGFAGIFTRKVVGVVTKIDALGAEREKARNRLFQVGVKDPIFFVSAHTREGIDVFMDYLMKGGVHNE